MRFIHDKSGLERLKKHNYSYKAGTSSDYDNIGKQKREASKDTKIRRDIHLLIIKMSNENKSSIEIKYALIEKYSNYEEYIVKMINQYFNKLNSANRRTRSSYEEKGDER